MRRDALADWYAVIIDTSFFNQLAGHDSGTTKKNGMNTVTAPSTNRRIIFDQNGTTHAAESSIGASDTFQLKLIDWALELAKTVTPVIRPIRMNGKEYFVLFMHPYQAVDMALDYGTGGWGDIQKAALQGGETTRNPLFTGALGVYKNVILHDSTRIPNPTGSVRRAVLCGAQAASIAFGREYEDAPLFKWKEEYFDYENQLGIAACTTYGMKKNIFNSEDYGTIVLSTYAASHTG